MRILQPPEKEVVGCSCIAGVNPRPARMRRTRGSALCTPRMRISLSTSLYSATYASPKTASPTIASWFSL